VDKKYKVITLCGSTKYKDAFIKAQKDLSLAGNVVISVGLYGHSGDEEVWTENKKAMLDDMHYQKIDMADEIYVINVEGYIGESTRKEIEYAIRHGKKVNYLVTCGDCENYTGIGDWNLSCTENHDPKDHPFGHLCYARTPACEKYKPITKLTKEEFVKRFCHGCGSQRCEGVDTD
jgi:hypothetical protein